MVHQGHIFFLLQSGFGRHRFGGICSAGCRAERSLGFHSERSVQGFCWGAPGAQHSSAPCLRPTTCSLCPGDTSRCVLARMYVCVWVLKPYSSSVAEKHNMVCYDLYIFLLLILFVTQVLHCSAVAQWWCAQRKNSTLKRTWLEDILICDALHLFVDI